MGGRERGGRKRAEVGRRLKREGGRGEVKEGREGKRAEMNGVREGTTHRQYNTTIRHSRTGSQS